jgi:hypothetical protein
MRSAKLILLHAATPLLVVGLVTLVLTTVQAGVDLISFEATADGDLIRVTWETADEQDMLGFVIQRALQEEGDYQPISDLILAGGPRFYEYADGDVTAGQTYYYKLEVIDLAGSTFYGPVSATPTRDRFKYLPYVLRSGPSIDEQASFAVGAYAMPAYLPVLLRPLLSF